MKGANNMKTILINAESGIVEIVDVVDDLDVFYAEINCRCIDIVFRTIGDRTYSIMCDDEGLFKEMPIISAVNSKTFERMFVGNLMIFNDNDEGDLEGLSDDDIDYIMQHINIDLMSGNPLLLCDY